jgi:hypothetical protein
VGFIPLLGLMLLPIIVETKGRATPAEIPAANTRAFDSVR